MSSSIRRRRRWSFLQLTPIASSPTWTLLLLTLAVSKVGSQDDWKQEEDTYKNDYRTPEEKIYPGRFYVAECDWSQMTFWPPKSPLTGINYPEEEDGLIEWRKEMVTLTKSWQEWQTLSTGVLRSYDMVPTRQPGAATYQRPKKLLYSSRPIPFCVSGLEPTTTFRRVIAGNLASQFDVEPDMDGRRMIDVVPELSRLRPFFKVSQPATGLPPMANEDGLAGSIDHYHGTSNEGAYIRAIHFSKIKVGNSIKANWIHIIVESRDTENEGAEGLEGLFLQSIGFANGVPFGKFESSFDCKSGITSQSVAATAAPEVNCRYPYNSLVLHEGADLRGPIQPPSVYAYGGRQVTKKNPDASPLQTVFRVHFTWDDHPQDCFNKMKLQFIVLAVRSFKNVEYEAFLTPAFIMTTGKGGLAERYGSSWTNVDCKDNLVRTGPPTKGDSAMQLIFNAGPSEHPIPYDDAYDTCSIDGTGLNGGGICPPQDHKSTTACQADFESGRKQPGCPIPRCPPPHQAEPMFWRARITDKGEDLTGFEGGVENLNLDIQVVHSHLVVQSLLKIGTPLGSKCRALQSICADPKFYYNVGKGLDGVDKRKGSGALHNYTTFLNELHGSEKFCLDKDKDPHCIAVRDLQEQVTKLNTGDALKTHIDKYHKGRSELDKLSMLDRQISTLKGMRMVVKSVSNREGTRQLFDQLLEEPTIGYPVYHDSHSPRAEIKLPQNLEKCESIITAKADKPSPPDDPDGLPLSLETLAAGLTGWLKVHRNRIKRENMDWAYEKLEAKELHSQIDALKSMVRLGDDTDPWPGAQFLTPLQVIAELQKAVVKDPENGRKALDAVLPNLKDEKENLKDLIEKIRDAGPKDSGFWQDLDSLHPKVNDQDFITNPKSLLQRMKDLVDAITKTPKDPGDTSGLLAEVEKTLRNILTVLATNPDKARHILKEVRDGAEGTFGVVTVEELIDQLIDADTDKDFQDPADPEKDLNKIKDKIDSTLKEEVLATDVKMNLSEDDDMNKPQCVPDTGSWDKSLDILNKKSKETRDFLIKVVNRLSEDPPTGWTTGSGVIEEKGGKTVTTQSWTMEQLKADLLEEVPTDILGAALQAKLVNLHPKTDAPGEGTVSPNEFYDLIKHLEGKEKTWTAKEIIEAIANILMSDPVDGLITLKPTIEYFKKIMDQTKQSDGKPHEGNFKIKDVLKKLVDNSPTSSKIRKKLTELESLIKGTAAEHQLISIDTLKKQEEALKEAAKLLIEEEVRKKILDPFVAHLEPGRACFQQVVYEEASTTVPELEEVGKSKRRRRKRQPGPGPGPVDDNKLCEATGTGPSYGPFVEKLMATLKKFPGKESKILRNELWYLKTFVLDEKADIKSTEFKPEYICEYIETLDSLQNRKPRENLQTIIDKTLLDPGGAGYGYLKEAVNELIQELGDTKISMNEFLKKLDEKTKLPADDDLKKAIKDLKDAMEGPAAGKKRVVDLGALKDLIDNAKTIEDVSKNNGPVTPGYTDPICCDYPDKERVDIEDETNEETGDIPPDEMSNFDFDNLYPDVSIETPNGVVFSTKYMKAFFNQSAKYMRRARSSHAWAMVLAWFLLMEIAVFTARYYKETGGINNDAKNGFYGLGFWIWFHVLLSLLAVTFYWLGVLQVASIRRRDLPCDTLKPNVTLKYNCRWYREVIRGHKRVGNVSAFLYHISLLFAWVRLVKNFTFEKGKIKLTINTRLISQWIHVFSGYMAKFCAVASVVLFLIVPTQKAQSICKDVTIWVIVFEVVTIIFFAIGWVIHWLELKSLDRSKRTIFPNLEAVEVADRSVSKWYWIKVGILIAYVVINLILFILVCVSCHFIYGRPGKGSHLKYKFETLSGMFGKCYVPSLTTEVFAYMEFQKHQTPAEP